MLELDVAPAFQNDWNNAVFNALPNTTSDSALRINATAQLFVRHCRPVEKKTGKMITRLTRTTS